MGSTFEVSGDISILSKIDAKICIERSRLRERLGVRELTRLVARRVVMVPMGVGGLEERKKRKKKERKKGRNYFLKI